MPNSDSRKLAIGPVGERVARNVEQLREARGLSLRGLSDRLALLARPILPSMLQVLCKGGRRVDADDLVALSVALKVNPNALLFPRDARFEDVVELTPEVRQRAWACWEWADGRTPLPAELVDEGGRYELRQADAVDFVTHARPDILLNRDHPAVRATAQLTTVLLLALTNPAGASTERGPVNRALQRVQLEVEELLEEAAD